MGTSAMQMAFWPAIASGSYSTNHCLKEIHLAYRSRKLGPMNDNCSVAPSTLRLSHKAGGSADFNKPF
jgi:hypothetical protein